MKLKMIESDRKEDFIEQVNAFMETHDIFSVKFQRNLYYSLSGSTHHLKEMNKETSTLKEGYVGFIVYKEEQDIIRDREALCTTIEDAIFAKEKSGDLR